MFALPTLTEFLDNPMGKGSTTIPNRQLIKDDLERRYHKLKDNKKFTMEVHRDNHEYYFHIKIPSETERDNTYDVVIFFTTEGDDKYNDDNFLKRYPIKFFSNCPSFTYTFAQTFDQAGFLIEFLRKKYKDVVLDKLPIVRNPAQIISFEKSIYFACLHIDDGYGLRNKMYINQLSVDFDKKKFFESIRSTDTVDMEIKRSKNKISNAKKKSDALHTGIKTRESVNTGKEKKGGVIGDRRIKPRAKIKPRRGSK